MQVKSTKLSKVKDSKLSNIDTIFINKGEQKYNYQLNYNDNNDTPILDIDTVIISKKIFKKHSSIELISTDAKNIYIEGEENLGGLTLHSKDLLHKYFYVEKSDDNDIKNRIEKINIIFENNVSTIELDESFDYIRVNNDYIRNGYIEVWLSNNKKHMEYKISFRTGTITKVKKIYYLTEEDVLDNALDMRNIMDYDSIDIYEKYSNKEKNDFLKEIDTIIFNKNVLKNIDKFENLLNFSHSPEEPRITPYLFPKNIRFIDENEMMLIPTDVTYSFKNAKSYKYENKRYLYLENNGNDVLISVDENDKLEIIEKNKLLNDALVEDISYKINVRKSKDNDWVISMVLIKYKDNTFTIKSFNRDYKIDTDFNKILLMNRDYLNLRPYIIDCLENNNWIKIFNESDFGNYKMDDYYNVYLEYIGALNYLHSLGLSERTIKYLWDRNYMKGLLDNINCNKEETLVKEEIETFKCLAKKYNS